MNGTQRKHGKTIGYIVTSDNGAQSVCYGLFDEKHRILLGGNPATIFKKLSHAKRAIRDSLKERDDRQFRITRVAFVSD